MRRLLGVFLLLGIVFFHAGCASRMGMYGYLYTGVAQPISATAQMAIKKGEACSMSIFGIIATGDASIDAARRNGGIKSIASVDEEYTLILGGLYTSVCTVVRGK